MGGPCRFLEMYARRNRGSPGAVRTCNRGGGPYAGGVAAVKRSVHDRSRVISSANSSSAAPCRITRQRINRLERARVAVAAHQAEQAGEQDAQGGKHQQGDENREEGLHCA